jgi:hypothetical protein
MGFLGNVEEFSALVLAEFEVKALPFGFELPSLRECCPFKDPPKFTEVKRPFCTIPAA